MNQGVLIDAIIQVGFKVDTLWNMFIGIHIPIIGYFLIQKKTEREGKTKILPTKVEITILLLAYSWFSFINGRALTNSYKLLDAFHTQFRESFGQPENFQPDLYQIFVTASYGGRGTTVMISHGLAFLVMLTMVLANSKMPGKVGRSLKDKLPRRRRQMDDDYGPAEGVYGGNTLYADAGAANGDASYQGDNSYSSPPLGAPSRGAPMFGETSPNNGTYSGASHGGFAFGSSSQDGGAGYRSPLAPPVYSPPPGPAPDQPANPIQSLTEQLRSARPQLPATPGPAGATRPPGAPLQPGPGQQPRMPTLSEIASQPMRVPAPGSELSGPGPEPGGVMAPEAPLPPFSPKTPNGTG